MSESIYIKETKEFLTESGHIVKEADLTPEEVENLKKECSTVNRLFGSSEEQAPILKG